MSLNGWVVSRASIFNPKTYACWIVDDRPYDVDRGGKLNFSFLTACHFSLRQ